MCQLVLAAFLMLPGVALANAGLPMLAIVWPLSIPVFLPVVAVESWVVHHRLEVTWETAITNVFKANLFSTAIGIPLAWLASTALEFLFALLAMNIGGFDSYPPHALGEVGNVILSAPWLGSFREGEHWIVPLATTVLLLPFFFASYRTESWFVADRLNSESPSKARQALWDANLLSYSGLLVGCVAWLAWGLATHK